MERNKDLVVVVQIDKRTDGSLLLFLFLQTHTEFLVCVVPRSLLNGRRTDGSEKATHKCDQQLKKENIYKRERNASVKSNDAKRTTLPLARCFVLFLLVLAISSRSPVIIIIIIIVVVVEVCCLSRREETLSIA